jgi:DNA-binding NarL/FixJ family response regulator
MNLTLVLADDHRIVRQGLRALLATEPEFGLVGEAADGLEAVRLVERLRPDVLVLDLMMPGLDGLEVARRVARQSPRTRTVILSMYANEAYVVEALRAGAVAYVLKESGAEELMQAVRAAAAGGRFLSPTISEHALRAYAQEAGGGPADPYDALTAREREVLQLTAEGHSGGAIAGRLFISPRTVESHRSNLMRKLGVRNQKELVRYAVLRGLLPGPAEGEGGRSGEPRERDLAR